MVKKTFIAVLLCITLVLGTMIVCFAMDSRVKQSKSDWTYEEEYPGKYALWAWGYVTADERHYVTVTCTYKKNTKQSDRKYGKGEVYTTSPEFKNLSWWECFTASVEHHTYYGFE